MSFSTELTGRLVEYVQVLDPATNQMTPYKKLNNGEFTMDIKFDNPSANDGYSKPLCVQIYGTDNINKFVGSGYAPGDTLLININLDTYEGNGANGAYLRNNISLWKHKLVSKAGQAAQPAAAIPAQAAPVAAPAPAPQPVAAPVAAPVSVGLNPALFADKGVIVEAGKHYYSDGTKWHVAVSGAWQVANVAPVGTAAPVAPVAPAAPTAPAAPAGSGGPASGQDDLPF